MRTYAHDNPLVGYPLAYQYLTSLRPDAVPASAQELLDKRSLGWRLRYSLGNQDAGTGMPLVSAFRWDTGVQLHASSGVINWTASVTSGTVSNPRFDDDNGGPQVAGRIELKPSNGLVAGVSLARGPFLGRNALRDAARLANGGLADREDTEFTQTALGADLEYSRHHYVLRFEAIGSRWRLPAVTAPALPPSLDALSTSIEGRYKLRPGLYVAARVDHLGFSDVRGTRETLPWDAPVRRVEIGAGYSLQRNLLLKGSYQINRRDGGVLERYANFPAAQLVFWF